MRCQSIGIECLQFLQESSVSCWQDSHSSAHKRRAMHTRHSNPEGRPEKKVEEEVLEAAEAEQRGDQLGVPEVETPEDTDTAVVEGPSLAEAAASPEQDSPESEQASPDDETVADETPTEEPAQAESTASAWSDEQLLGAGWTQEQIDAMRNG